MLRPCYAPSMPCRARATYLLTVVHRSTFATNGNFISSSSSSSAVSELPSLKYTHFPDSPFWSSCAPSVSPGRAGTQSYRLGPETGELSQICLLNGCLLMT